MAQDIEKVINLLNNMQKSNTANADSFERLLTSIGSKIDTVDSNTNTELLKAYINELTKSVDDKYSNTLNKFEDIEKAIKAVYESQGETVKNSDMKDLFEVFSKNVNNFYTEARQEKAILAGIETKIGDIASNKTDKEDILRTISLLRNDLGNVNLTYKNTIDDINTTLKSVLAGIKSVDPLKTGDTAKAQIDVIYKSISELINTLEEIENREKKLEKILGNLVTNEDLKVTKGIIDSIIEKTNEIDEKLDSNAQKDDMDEIRQALDEISRRTARSTSVDDFSQIQQQTEDILSYTDEIKQTLSKVAQDIEHVPDASDLERSLTELYSQINNLAQNVSHTDSKLDMPEIVSKLDIFGQELEIIKNIVTDLNDALTSKVMASLESVTESGSELGQIVSDTFKNIPQKEDIEKLLENNKILDGIYNKAASIENWLIASNIKENSEKIATQIEHTSTSDEVAQIQYTTNEIISVLEKLSKTYDVEQVSLSISKIGTRLNEIISVLEKRTPDAGDSSVYEKLSDLERSISQIVSRGEFDEFIGDLKDCIANLSSNTGSCCENVEQMQQIQREIETRLSELDFSKTAEALEGKFEQLHDKIESLQNNLISIEDFIKNNSPADYGYIKSELEAIKSLILSTNSSDFDNIENPDADSVKSYLSEVKNIIQGNPKSGLYSKIQNIEDSLVNNQTFNETAFAQVMDKISEIKLNKIGAGNNDEIAQAIREISSLRDRIENLAECFCSEVSENIDNPEKAYILKIENFISKKLEEISSNIDKITENSEHKISEGFTYQTELLEQKTEQLQRLISDIGLNSTIENPQFSQKLSDASETLGDFRQELQLVSTDITENISQKASQILDELAPIREILEKINKNANPQHLRAEVEDLNHSLLDAPELADFSSDIEDLYGRLTEKFTENENNLKDFILTDTDSIIIKLDNLRDYVEKSLDAIVPPDAKDMAELQKFVEELKDFKENQAKLLGQSVDEIKKEIKQQSDEIKSMLSIANNHEDIICAIEELKRSFKSKAKKKSKEDDTSESITYSDDAIEDLKADFAKYSKEIEKLSDDNTRISNILQSISNRLGNTFVKPQSLSEERIDDDFEVTEDDIFGEDKFDFVQAFDILQNDIRNLSSKVEEAKNSENKESSKIPSISNSGIVMNINSKVDEILKSLNNSWLTDIEKYIKEGNIGLDAKLDSIESKLDVFVSDTTNTDILNEVSETLGDINDSVADLSESDKKLSSMLEELNEKITQIGTDDNSLEEINNIKTLIGEQKTYIENLEPNEKLQAFKKCLDEISFEVNALAADSNADREKLNKTIKEMKESLMSAVVTIFDQVSFMEETEDIKDFVEERTDEINKNIAQITKQLHQMTSSSGEDANYTYSMQDIETDLAKLRLALQDSRQIDLTEITEKLHSITSSVDSLTQDEMKELKTEITTLKEQTEFLIANSDKSYNVINTGIEGIINDNITSKVEKLSQMLESSAQSDQVIKQALIYIGEWIDSATTSINKISTNSEEINEVLNGIESVNTNINNAIEEKFAFWNAQIKSLEKQFIKVESLETQLVNQQERIDRLEVNIDKLLSIVENLEDPGITRKIDKIEKQLSKLGTNVEKLASYVD